MAVVSQPCNGNCNLPPPGEMDNALNEFWVGNPWTIFRQHNLSSFERDRFFLNAGGRRFLDISFVSGADHDGDSRASLAADFNHDGMLDLAVRQAGGKPLLIYENRFPPRHYLRVTLRGTQSNRLGVGARLIAKVADRQIVRERYPVNSYLSQAPLAVHFGLGEAERVDLLTIHWPSGVTQHLTNLPADQHVVVTEGSDEHELTQPGKTIPP